MSVCDNCGNKVYCEADDQWCGKRVKELSKEIERLKKQALTEDVVEDCEYCEFAETIGNMPIGTEFNYCPNCGKQLVKGEEE